MWVRRVDAVLSSENGAPRFRWDRGSSLHFHSEGHFNTIYIEVNKGIDPPFATCPNVALDSR